MILHGELTAERAREEIRAREESVPQLVGPLWPGVLRDEIAELKRALAALGG